MSKHSSQSNFLSGNFYFKIKSLELENDHLYKEKEDWVCTKPGHFSFVILYRNELDHFKKKINIKILKSNKWLCWNRLV